jgi:hypothetical protein
VSNHHDRFLARVLFQQLAEISQAGFRAKARIHLQLAFVT